MSIFGLSNNQMRIPVALAFALCLGLIVATLMSFPSRSRAQLEPVQETKSAKKTQSRRFAPGKVLVRYKSESIAKLRTGSLRVATKDGELLSMKVDDFGASSMLPGLRLARVDENDTLKAVGALREHPDVLYAELNYILKANVNPNDPRFNQQDYLNRIGAPQAWNTTAGSRSIVVGVLDQGIDISHQDLQANIWTNPQPGAVGGGIAGDLHGYNFVDNNGTIFVDNDAETHATHVAGILGAVGNNNRGVAGVNWAVNLMSLRFLDEDGTGETANAIRACVYAKQMRDLWETAPVHTKGANIRVLNASFGGAPFTQSFLDSIKALNSAGILFVAAAGNTTDDGTREPNNDRVPHFPSSFNAPNVIAVGSTDQSDLFATAFSHSGPTSVDLAAPGDSVLSTTPPCANPGPNNACNPSFTDAGETYTIFSGTSMSTPQVSVAAALLWAHNPNLTVQQVKNLLLLDGDIITSLIDETLTGRRLNIANSFQSLAENDTTLPGPVTNFHINSQNGRTFNVGWTTSGDDGANGQASLYQLNFTDGGSGAVIPLKGILPLESGLGQIATVTIPFRHLSGTLSMLAFDNAGNQSTPVSLPIGIPLSIGDPYTSSTGPSVALTTTGINLNPDADDDYVSFIAPPGFSFPFFGQTYTDLTLSTNGAIYFGDTPPTRPADNSADDVPSSPGKLGGYTAIAGLWDDLNLEVAPSRPDAGIFVISNPGQLIFRWQGRPCDFNGTQCAGTTPVNFEIELNSNGVIKTRYGAGNTNLTPTVGIGGGGQEAYFIPSHTSEDTKINLTNAQEVTFSPRAATVSNIQLSGPSFNVTEGTNTVSVNVTRTGDTTSVANVSYATSDAAGAANCSTIGATASRRCDYLTSVGTLKFAAGETSKAITVSIVNDAYAENAETFSIALNSPIGATLGATTSATITINDNAGEGGPNPINDAAFFVRQHYNDFLNRQPDTPGLNFWTNEITSCGSDTQCIEVKRINVSAAFFLSIEFQETGYLVYRIYKAGLGDLPNLAPVPVAFNEFLRDTQEIGQNVQVGIGDWQNQLEANKQAFAIAFVQRPEFLVVYPAGMTATQVVNQMEANAGITLSAPQKTSLINLLGATPADLSKRGAALRAVAEANVLRQAEFNKAFVLMQYFGYLRRNPNDPPDTDYGGFNFWLGKLNQFNGNFVNAEMVKAFLLSGEYLRRFQN